MSAPRIYDVSLGIHPGMSVWPGDPPVSLESVSSVADGDAYTVSRLLIGTHTGTHVDAPRHFFPGLPGVDGINLAVLLGRARLFQLSEEKSLDRTLLEKLDIAGVTRMLFGTRNTGLLRPTKFRDEYAALTADGARYLLEKGTKLIGIDSLSIDAHHAEGYPAHRLLLERGVVIVEGLNLAGVPSGDYELICLPLRIENGDAAPARVLLRELA